VQNPSAEFAAAITKAGQQATFTERLSPRMETLQRAVAGSAFEFVLPFIKTPANLFSYSMQRIPGINLISARWRADFAAGGAARDMAIARVIVGGAITATAFSMAEDGLITGGGLADKDARRAKQAAGWQPYSIKIGDTYYSYQRLEPIGKILAVVADAYEAYAKGTGDTKADAFQLATLAIGNATISQTYLSGLSNAMNALVDPARYADRFLDQYAMSLVPKIVGQTAAAMDPEAREVDSIADAIQSQIPILREQLRPRRDAFGDPVTPERAFPLAPSPRATPATTRCCTEAARLGVNIAAIPKDVKLPAAGIKGLGSVELTSEQRDVYASVTGKFAHEILSTIVNAPTWDAIPEPAKAKIYQKVFTAARKQGAIAGLCPGGRGKR
jgi:hypothetical protein